MCRRAEGGAEQGLRVSRHRRTGEMRGDGRGERRGRSLPKTWLDGSYFWRGATGMICIWCAKSGRTPKREMGAQAKLFRLSLWKARSGEKRTKRNGDRAVGQATPGSGHLHAEAQDPRIRACQIQPTLSLSRKHSYILLEMDGLGEGHGAPSSPLICSGMITG